MEHQEVLKENTTIKLFLTMDTELKSLISQVRMDAIKLAVRFATLELPT